MEFFESIRGIALGAVRGNVASVSPAGCDCRPGQSPACKDSVMFDTWKQAEPWE